MDGLDEWAGVDTISTAVMNLVGQVLVAKQVTAIQKEQPLILVTAILTIAAPTTAAPAPVANSISLCFRCTFGFPCTV